MIRFLGIFACISSLLIPSLGTQAWQNLLNLDENEFCSGSVDVSFFPQEITKLLGFLRYCFESSKDLTGLEGSVRRYVLNILLEEATPLFHEAFLQGYTDIQSVIDFSELKSTADEAKVLKSRVTRGHISNNYDEKRKPTASVSNILKTCENIVNICKVNSFQPATGLFPKVKNYSISFPGLNNFSANLTDKDAPYIILDFYVLTIRCLELARIDRGTVYQITSDFLNWVEKEVMPYLSEKEQEVTFKNIDKIVNSLYVNNAQLSMDIAEEKGSNVDVRRKYFHSKGKNLHDLLTSENNKKDWFTNKEIKIGNYHLTLHNALLFTIGFLSCCSCFFVCFKYFISKRNRNCQRQLRGKDEEILHCFNMELENILDGYKSKKLSEISLKRCGSSSSPSSNRERIVQEEIMLLNRRCTELSNRINTVLEEYMDTPPVYRSSSDLKDIITMVSQSLEDDEKCTQPHCVRPK